MTPDATPSTPARIVVAYAIVVALAAAVSLHRLGAPDVCGANEAVEAVFLQQMVEHDALLFPLENGAAPMYKPPLFHWTAVALDRLAGVTRVTPFNLRLPAALYAIAGVVLTIIFAAGLLGPPGAILAGLILAASYQYVENARIGRVDMTLCFLETLALFAFMWWYAPAGPPPSAAAEAGATSTAAPTGGDSTRYLLALAMGLAVLAKGPVGAILPGLAIAIFLIAEHRPGLILRLATPGPVILTVALGASWYLACLFGRRYGFLDRQLGSENFGRFFGALGAMAPWYYLKPILFNSAPLSLLVPFAIYGALRTGWNSLPPAAPEREAAAAPSTESAPPHAPYPQRPAQNPLSLWMSLRMMFLPAMDPAAAADRAASPRARAAVRLFAIFWIVTVLFFTVAAYKRRAYLLPLWPATAVTLAWWLAARADRPWGVHLRRTVGAACAVMIVFNFFYLPRREIRECTGDSFRIAAAQINRVVGLSEPLYLYDFTDEPAPLLFYLDRPAPRITGKLGDAPPGYVLAPVATWNRLKPSALDLTPVLETSSGRPRLVLLRRGPALASR